MKHSDAILRFGALLVLALGVVTTSSISARSQPTQGAWLGVSVRSEGSGLSTHVVVVDVVPGGPGAQAGLRARDVILSIQGQGVRTMDDVVRIMQSVQAGSRVALTILRGQQQTALTVISGQSPAETGRPPRALTEGAPVPGQPGAGQPAVSSELMSRQWRRLTSPQGRFSVELPEGWEIKSREADESSVSFGPGGQDTPSAGILGWLLSDSLHMLRTGQVGGAAFYCRQIGAQEFYGQTLLPVLRQRLQATIQLERIAATSSPAVAVAEGHASVQGRPFKFIDLVSMEYVPDETLTLIYRCPQTWWNLAFARGLVAAPEEFEALKPVAARIFASFTPTPRWGVESREAIFHGIQTRLQMIGRTLSNINRMQMDQMMQEMESTRRWGQRWVDVLGGVARWKDPATSREGTIPSTSIPTQPTKWWLCPWRPDAIPSNTWPGSGCNEVPAPR